MKRVLGFVLVLGLAGSAFAFGGPAPTPSDNGGQPTAQEGVLVIDDFESGSIISPGEWWTFDIQTARAVSNDDLTRGEDLDVGDYSLLLKGQAKNWYAGGFGAYIAKEKQDLSKYSYMQIDIYGNGPGSGTLKIELLDDDNNNWQVEQDPSKGYVPIHDDKYVYDIRVDWVGWKREVIDLEDFVDDNPGVGDDIWNPGQRGGSGGLLQIQFICLGSKGEATINYNLDNILLTVKEE